jgi:hypothetical protein
MLKKTKYIIDLHIYYKQDEHYINLTFTKTVKRKSQILNAIKGFQLSKYAQSFKLKIQKVITFNNKTYHSMFYSYDFKFTSLTIHQFIYKHINYHKYVMPIILNYIKNY